MAAYTILVVLSLVLVSSGRHFEKRVIGGQQYERGEFPFSVSLWYMGDNNIYTENTPDLHHTCGGSLIHPSWVLASALCFDDDLIPGLSNLTLWHAVLGMYGQKDAEGQAQFRTIEQVFKSNEYNFVRSYGDIALLKLSEPADVDDVFVSTIGYNDNVNCPAVGQKCTVIGWGQTKEAPYGYGAEFPSDASVTVDSETYCRDAYLKPNITALMGPLKIDERILCAGEPEGGVDACYGDSGSPLLCECQKGDQLHTVVAATVSYGFGCANPGFPGVYSRVSSYADWIKDTMAKN